MQKILKVLVLALTGSILFACSDNSEVKPATVDLNKSPGCQTQNLSFPANSCKPDTVIFSQNVNGSLQTDTITFKYDNQNRLAEAFNLVNRGNTKYIKYNYFADSIQEESYSSYPGSQTNLVGRLTFYIHQSCQINKIKDQRANYAPINYFVTYNSSNMIEKIEMEPHPQYSLTTNFSSTNGNIISRETTGVSGSGKYSYEFYNQANQLNLFTQITIAYVNPINEIGLDYDFRKRFLGMQNANLLKKVTYGQGSSSTFDTDYTYIFDANGRVKEINSQKFFGFQTNNNWKFSYNCN